MSGRTRMTNDIELQNRSQTEIDSPRLRWTKKWREFKEKCGFSLTIRHYSAIILPKQDVVLRLSIRRE